MPPIKQTIYDIYFQITEESLQKYGPQTILFYQVGAFFELYGVQELISKKIIKSKVDEFTQMAQLNMSAKEIETDAGIIVMAGFRDYSLDKYLKVATTNGFTAVVYTQNMENPKAITREFYGVYSPGTFISYDTDSSQELSNNIVCIWLSTYTPIHSKTPQLLCGVSSAHIFTGESTLYEYETSFIMNPTTFDELERSISLIAPSEVIIISFLSDKMINQVLSYTGLTECRVKPHIISMETETNIDKRNTVEKCMNQTFINHQLSTCFGTECYQICQEFSQYPTATQSFLYLLHFLQERNPDLLKKMTIPRFHNSSHRVRLANHTLQQLNMIDDGNEKGKFSSVASFLNQCCTPMGKRAFYQKITNPTSNTSWLEAEYSAIDSFMTIPQDSFISLRKDLHTIRDLEKISRQTVLQKVYPNTIFQLYESMLTISKWTTWFEKYENLTAYFGKITPVEDFTSYLSSVLYIDRCKNVETLLSFQECLFRPGHFENLDKVTAKYQEYQTLFDNIHKGLNKVMKTKPSDDTEYVKIHETEKSGVSLQITKKRAETLRNNLKGDMTFVGLGTTQICVQTKDIRFTKASGTTEEIEFPQLKTLLDCLQTTKEQWSLEIARAFSELLRTLEKDWYNKLEEWTQWTIQVDVLQSKTHVAQKYGYCKPVIQKSHRAFVDAQGIRHILIEHIQQNEVYVSNDICLSTSYSDHDGILLFGTNAVGKTSLIRAIGICVILAQCGLYVPCTSFTFSPYTAIFSRIIGNDNLFKGLSTFAVEMSELRVILKSANENSLVLGDELCSGTETESALSLFSAGLIDLSKKGATFLFATHFHEITQYDEIRELTRLGLKHMTVRYDPSSQILLYDRLLKDGQGARMYGLEVCRSLYMDQDFLDKAYYLRNKYFPEQKGELGSAEPSVYNVKKIRGKCEMCHTELASETHHLSPQKDANELGLINGRFHKNHPANLASVCEACHLKTHSMKRTVLKKKTTKGYILEEVSDHSSDQSSD